MRINNKTKRNNEEKINFKYNLSEYVSFFKNCKMLFVSILVLTFVLEAASLADKYLFKIIIDKGTMFSSGEMDYSSLTAILAVIAVVFLIIMIVRIIGRWLHIHLINRLDNELILSLKRKYFNHILSLSYNFHTTNRTGSLISRLTRGRNAIEGLTDAVVFNFIPLLFQLLILTTTLIYLDFFSSVIIFLVVVLFISYNLLIQTLQNNSNLAANDAEDYEKANISDFFTNVESIKYFGKEKEVKKRFSFITDSTKNALYKNWNYFRWLDSGQALILGIGTFFVVYFPLMSFLKGNLTLGTVVFIYTAYSTVVSSMFSFVSGLRRFYSVMSDFNALFLYGKINNEIKDKPEAGELEIKKGEIEFQNISFSYGKRNIFSNFSLRVPAKKIVAFVGHSGSGKTSLVKLLYRMYETDSGRILLDNKDIKDFRQESLRSGMSIVPQECVLFNDTIYNNILFSKPDASREEVINAIKFAQLNETIDSLPNKENTIVGERGVKLSGGEKQRVSIARAVLADKKILILDEATSSLDSKTEAEIQKDLRKLMKGRTTLIIAHRLSTIMKADIIVVMEKGKIIQIGKHNDLIKYSGEYKKLWNLQKGKYKK